MKRTWVVALFLLLLSPTEAQTFKFKIDPDRTFTEGGLKIKYWTQGSFVGDYDHNELPGGTRTIKPPKSLTGNDRIAAKPVWSFERRGIFRTFGTFDLSLDMQSGEAIVEHYAAERTADGPTPINVLCELNNDPFQTAMPDANFLGPIGAFSADNMVLDRLRVVQAPGKRKGTITELSEGRYRVSVTFMADVLIDVLQLGQENPLTFPMAVSLVGDFYLTDKGAEFAYLKGEGGDNWLHDVNTPLEEFWLLIPTTPEQSAKVRLKSTVKRVSVALNGMRQFYASGEEVKPQ